MTPSPDRVRLHVVTGKGGSGKTTVATALAMALARDGRTVLLVEVEERQGLAQTLDTPPLGPVERRVADGPGGAALWALSVEARASLLEYLQQFYRLGRAGSVLEKVGAIDFATTIAPGVRDVLLIGKVFEATRRTSGRPHPKGTPEHYDAIVLDAPPTGRITRFLSVNEQVADLAKAGPIHSQAGAITTLLHSDQTRVHVVTLLEEMPVQETVDAVAELREAGLPVGAVVVNQARAALLDEPDEVALLALADGTIDVPAVADAIGSVGIDDPQRVASSLLDTARGYRDRLDLEATQYDLLEQLGLPLVLLPLLPDGIDGGALAELADLLAEELDPEPDEDAGQLDLPESGLAR